MSRRVNAFDPGLVLVASEPDSNPVELDPGHPWAGLVLRPAWIRWYDERTGRVRWTWRPHVEAMT